MTKEKQDADTLGSETLTKSLKLTTNIKKQDSR